MILTRNIVGCCKQSGRANEMGSCGGCMEGEVYNFNQSTIILHGQPLCNAKGACGETRCPNATRGKPTCNSVHAYD